MRKYQASDTTRYDRYRVESHATHEDRMRTTLNIDDDVLNAAREIARQRRQTIGKVVSDLARRALVKHETGDMCGGVSLFPVQSDGRMVTLEIVNQLRDERE